MRIVALYYTATMALVAIITGVAVLWCHLNHLRVAQGPVLFTFSPAHGVHVFDVAVLALELLLLALLSIILFAGFSRPATSQ